MAEKTIAFRIDENLHKRIKKALIDQDMSLKDWVTMAIIHELDGGVVNMMEYTDPKYGKMSITLNDLLRYMKMEVEQRAKK